MSELVIPDVDDSILARLKVRAKHHGRTDVAEAKIILTEALQPKSVPGWDEVDAIHQRLSAAGRRFDDSTDIVREDRERFNGVN